MSKGNIGQKSLLKSACPASSRSMLIAPGHHLQCIFPPLSYNSKPIQQVREFFRTKVCLSDKGVSGRGVWQILMSCYSRWTSG